VKALKIIPLFVLLIFFTYLGMLFVEANRQEVVIEFFHLQSPPAALGFVVLTSVLIGMCLAGALCSVELLALYVQYKKIQRLGHRETKPEASEPSGLASRLSGG
jgi:uncharacterized integral membrane protein